MASVLYARIYPDGDGYSATCDAVHAYTQGADINEAVENLKEAIALALEDEDLSDFGLEPGFAIFITIEIPSAIHA